MMKALKCRIIKVTINFLTFLSASTVIAEPAQIVVMVYPETFAYNPQTAVNNGFSTWTTVDPTLLKKVHSEFEGMVKKLQQHQMTVVVLPSPSNVSTPDAVFPNNWFTVNLRSQKRILTTYPMQAVNRRLERQTDVLKTQLSKIAKPIFQHEDWAYFEGKKQYLEGTGSLVLDRGQKIMYASLSERTSGDVVGELAKHWGYVPIIFHSYDASNRLIYHTNVMMSIRQDFAVICLECIKDLNERNRVYSQLKKSKTVIPIGLSQVHQMCGNILELKNIQNQHKLIMSTTAYAGYSKAQKQLLEHYAEIVPVSINTIETISGVSARCMMAEVF